MSCEQCIRAEPHHRSRRCHSNWFGSGTTSSGGYKNMVTVMDMISRFYFPTLQRNKMLKQLPDSCWKSSLSMHTFRRWFFPTKVKLLYPKWKKTTDVMGITTENATIRNTRKIDTLERTQASLKKAIKIEKGEGRSMWHRYLNIDFLNYNTSCHTSIVANLADHFMGVLHTMFLIQKGAIVYRNYLCLNSKLPKIFLSKPRWFSKICAKRPCRLESNIKPITTKNKNFWT